MNAIRWTSVLLAVMLCTACVRAADEVEVKGVAKVGDGSATAKDWQDGQACQAKKASKLDELLAMSCKPQPIPADWVVNVKRMPCASASVFSSAARAQELPESAAGSYYCMNGLETEDKGGGFWTFTVLQGPESGDWFAIKNYCESEQNAGTLAAQIATMRAYLQKAGHPLSAQQDKKLAELRREVNIPELVETWKQVQAKPDDKPLAAAFVRACMKAKDDYVCRYTSFSKKMMEVLTPEQVRAWDAAHQGASCSQTSTGAGTFSVNQVKRQDGTREFVVVIADMPLSDAFGSLVQFVNDNHRCLISVPKIPAELAGKRVSTRLVITKPDSALEKLAAAAGMKLVGTGKEASVVEAK